MENILTIKKYSKACPNELCKTICKRIGNLADVTMNGTRIYINGFIPKWVDVRGEVDKVIKNTLGYDINYDISIFPCETCHDVIPEFAYATNETPLLIPVAEKVASCFLKLMKNHPSRMFLPKCSIAVSYDVNQERITKMCCNIEHSKDVEISDFKHIVDSVMLLSAIDNNLNSDFEKAITDYDFSLFGTYVHGNDNSNAHAIADFIVYSGCADKCSVWLYGTDLLIDCHRTEYMNYEIIYKKVEEQFIYGWGGENDSI